MKKKTLKELVRELQEKVNDQHNELCAIRVERRDLRAEVEQMRTHWRPVPITHEWQPRNPQCALCDEPRDSQRHREWSPETVVPHG